MCSDPESRSARSFRRDGLALAGALAILAAVAAGTAGCGKQGPPLPPLKAVPAKTSDLALRLRGPQLLLELTYPKTTAGGLVLGNLAGLEVWEAVRPPSPEGKAPPLDERQFKAVAAQKLKLSAQDIGSVTYGDRLVLSVPLPEPLPDPAQARYYAVRTLGPKGDASEYSNQVALVPKAPPASPQPSTVTPTGEGVKVEWTAVEGAAGYNVYRRGSQERVYGRPLFTSGPGDTSWVDASAAFGQDYIYAVTALAEREPPIESAIGSEREVRYQDRFAPPAPQELVALAEQGRVRLVWRASDAPDLAGYVVYRRGPAGDFTRLNAQPAESPEYVDTAAASGRTFTYRVTAVDASGNESAPSNEIQAAVP